MFVDVVESPPDAAPLHIVEGVWELDGSGTKVDVDSAALSQSVVVFAAAAPLGCVGVVGLAVLRQLSLPGLSSTCGHLVSHRLRGSGLPGATAGGGVAGLWVAL